MRRDFDGAEKKADLIHASAENTAGRLTSYMLALRILQETDLIHGSAENTAGRLTSYMAALRILQED